MKLSQRINDLLNLQIMHELKNSNIYLQIASYFEDYQLQNLATYFYNQSQEEKEHANKFVKYINSRTGGKVSIGSVESPELQITKIEDVGRIYVETEEKTTEQIEEIMSVIRDEQSYTDEMFILSMLAEQVQEEDSATEFALKLEMVQDIVLFDATFK